MTGTRPEVFYKYMSASTAKAVLGSASLRWSSPLIFNDPFDFPRELAFGFSPSDLQLATGEVFAEYLQNPPADLSDFKPVFAYIFNAARGATPEQRKELVNGALDEAAKQAPLRTSHTLDEMRGLWRSWLPEFRILCLASNCSAASMWYHYADKYAGVVLELGASKPDSPLVLAEPVQYPTQTPDIFTLKGWVRLMFLKTELSIKALLRAYAIHKTPDWAYEGEWRVIAFKRPSETGLFSDWRAAPQDFIRVIFGPQITDANRLEILSLLRGELAHVQPLQASFGLDRKFSFQPMTLS